MTPAPSLRQRHMDRTRAALVAAAVGLFRERGFAATTVEEIAGRADVAPRTFFRYFPTKEAVLFHDVEDHLTVLRARLAERPPDEPAPESLAIALTGFADEMTSNRDHAMLIRRLAETHSGLLFEYRRTLTGRIVEQLAKDLATRQGLAEPTVGLRAQVAAVMVCMSAAVQACTDAGPDAKPVMFVNEALAAGAEALTAAVAHLVRSVD